MDNKISILAHELKKLNKDEIIEKINKLDTKIIDFLIDSIDKKKGYIFVYHQSEYEQNYDFKINPSIVLTIHEFLEIQDIFVFHEGYQVIPLLLAKGSIYSKIADNTNLEVCDPLILNEHDVNLLIKKCRKENCINLWAIHSRKQSNFIDWLEKSLPIGDEIVNVDDVYTFNDGVQYHVVLLLMSEGAHYHQFINQIPMGVSVSKILPLDKKIKEWIEEKVVINQ